MNPSNNDYWVITLLSFDLWRNHHIKNVVLFEENSTLPLPERLEAPGVKSVWGEVSQESPKNRRKNNLENRPINRPLYLVRPLTRRAVVFKCVDTPLRTCLARLVGCRANNWFSVLRHSFSVKRLRDGQSLVYSAVIITCVHYLGPPGPLFRDILEVHTNHRRKKETDSNTTQLFVGIKLRADKRTVCKEPLETAWRACSSCASCKNPMKLEHSGSKVSAWYEQLRMRWIRSLTLDKHNSRDSAAS